MGRRVAGVPSLYGERAWEGTGLALGGGGCCGGMEEAGRRGGSGGAQLGRKGGCRVVVSGEKGGTAVVKGSGATVREREWPGGERVGRGGRTGEESPGQGRTRSCGAGRRARKRAVCGARDPGTVGSGRARSTPEVASGGGASVGQERPGGDADSRGVGDARALDGGALRDAARHDGRRGVERREGRAAVYAAERRGVGPRRARRGDGSQSRVGCVRGWGSRRAPELCRAGTKAARKGGCRGGEKLNCGWSRVGEG